MAKARAHLVISGVVQGVFFRATTRDQAEMHGVTGWVKNNPDGTVEAVLEGERGDVEKVVEFCGQGPPSARVDDVELRWEDPRDEFDGFHMLTRHNTY